MIETVLGSTRRPDISFYRKRAKIDIYSRISKMLNLSEGDVVDIARDKGEYFIYRRHKSGVMGKHRGVLKKPHNVSVSFLRVYSRPLCEAIFCASSKFEGMDVLKLPAGEPVELEGLGTAVPLITRNPL